MNLPPPPATRSGLDSSPLLPGTKRRRVSVACERCHKSRVRCDAHWVGLPCSRCKGKNRDSCRFIQSKKRRGVDGRFVPVDTGLSLDGPSHPDESSTISITPSYNAAGSNSCRTSLPVDTTGAARTQVDLGSPNQASTPSTRSSLQRLTPSPNFAVDLETLCRVNTKDTESQITTSDPGRRQDAPPHITVLDSTDDTQEARQTEPISYMGESWFLSFVLHNTNNEATSRHRSVWHSSGNCEASRPSDNCFESPTHTTGLAEASCHSPLPESLSGDICEKLLDAYFSYFQPLCPIIDKEPFLNSVRERNISRTLLLSVCFIASVHCDMEALHSLGYQTRVEAGDDLFSKADKALASDTDSDRITIMISSYLLHYWWGKPVKFDDSLWRLAGVIRSGQCLGMHHSTANSHMIVDVRRRWKRLWWLLYIRDRQVSLCLGMPMIINDDDCTLEDLEVEDFPSEPRETAQYIIAQASLSRAACEVRKYISSILFQDPQPPIVEAEQEIMRLFEAWRRSLPEDMCCSKNASQLALTLQITFNLYRIIFLQKLHRAYQEPPNTTRSSHDIIDMAGTITSFTEQALTHYEARSLPMICVTAIFAAMSVQYAASFSSKVYTSQILLHKLRTNLLGLEQLEQVYSLATWIRRLFSKVLEKPEPRRKPTPTSQGSAGGNLPSFADEAASQLGLARPSASRTVSEVVPLLPLSSSLNQRYHESEIVTTGLGTTTSAPIAAEETVGACPSPIPQGDLLFPNMWGNEPGDFPNFEAQFLNSNALRHRPLLSPLELENMRLLGLGTDFSYDI